MTDRELLEKAARAVYYHYDPDEGICGTLYVDKFVAREHGWNPLEDDGDAFRLMVVCRLFLQVSDDDGGCTRVLDEFGDTILREMHVNDDSENAATRRAIVRAAAAMATD